VVWRESALAAGILAELILALDVPSILASNLLLSEALFTLLITLTMVVLLGTLGKEVINIRTVVMALGAGLALALAITVRPIGQVLILIAPLYAFYLSRLSGSRKIVLSVLFIAVPLLMIVSWSYRNYRQRGIWAFSTIKAVNMLYYRAAGVLAYETGKPFAEVQAGLLRTSGGLEGNPSEIEKRGMRVLREHPWVAGRDMLAGFLRNCFQFRGDIGQVLGYDGLERTLRPKLKPASPRSTWLSAVVLVEFTLLALTWVGVGLALWCAFYAQLVSPGLVLIPLSMALLLVAAAAGPEAYIRFRVPSMPMLAMVGAIGWTAVARNVRSRYWAESR
jgi:hypothetical protein